MSMCLYHLAIYGSPSQRRGRPKKKKHSRTVRLLSQRMRVAWRQSGKAKKSRCCVVELLPHRPPGTSPTKLFSTFPPFPFAVPFELPTESFFLLSSHEELQTRTDHFSASLCSLSSLDPSSPLSYLRLLLEGKRSFQKLVSLPTSFVHPFIFPPAFPASFASSFHFNTHLFTNFTSPSSLQSWRPRQPHRLQRPMALLLQLLPPLLLEQGRS